MRKRHSFLSVDDLNDGDIDRLFLCARKFKENKEFLDLSQKNVVLMTAFFEPSTRTRLSFEMAAHRLKVRTVVFDSNGSSLKKGESEDETIANLLNFAPDFLVIRRRETLRHDMLDACNCIVINGGDGINEHPTQALLDCFTLLDHFKCDDLSHKSILIIGDIAHSRVARSNIKLMKRLGAKITLLAPEHFRLKEGQKDVDEITDFADVPKIDVVMCLRLQKERYGENFRCDEEEFAKNFGLTLARYVRFKEKPVVLHPGPHNCNIEIDNTVATHPRSLINQQVRNGVVVRAALLSELFLRR